ncbi:MAG: UDP-N-acetylmuramate--L-alanine ligase [Rhodospirillaceae bacterium]|nr:UDP-N-acetylmuramate--L-alanine ligase [Rhodospirillaceae bacterium]|tara:strand:+ start:82319 stop:83758 length:1440 start_codon:yes stop_codon:yes gene_type:complete
MRTLPLSIGKIHFCGIGGIGMSGIAEVLHNLGYSVQGSDIAKNANVNRLTEMGIPVSIGQSDDNLGEATVIVVSSAIKPDNPELVAARQRHIPVVRRAEMLAELMRLKWAIAVGGTHGKTTTTSLIAAMLDTAGTDPTVINGGIINAYGTNARLGEGEWVVVEADESDGTFIKLPATIAVVTNIDPEHLDFYGSFDEVRRAFVSFVANIPFYGLAVLCIDHPEVQALIPQVSDRKIITYGFNAQADIRAENLSTSESHAEFDIVFSGRSAMSGTRLERVSLPMVGKHNVQNALAAVAIAQEMDTPAETIRQGLAAFSGVKRRFTVTGKSNGITIVDDYGHHPVEIEAVLAAARASARGRVIAVVQPHRYSRLKDLFEDFCTCFNDADTVVVADVYPAGEQPLKGIDRDALIDGLRAHGHRDVVPLQDADALPGLIKEIGTDGDMVICLGAGNITAWANELPSALDTIFGDDAMVREVGR